MLSIFGFVETCQKGKIVEKWSRIFWDCRHKNLQQQVSHRRRIGPRSVFGKTDYGTSRIFFKKAAILPAEILLVTQEGQVRTIRICFETFETSLEYR